MNSEITTATTASATTIVDTLAALHRRRPDEVALTILDDGEEVSARATFRELHENAQLIAGILRQKYPHGSRVVLLLPTGLHFVHAFFGCLAAGMIAVPASHPQQTKRLSQWKRLQAIVDNSGAELIITTAKSAGLLDELRRSEGLFDRCEIRDVATFSSADAPAQSNATDLAASISADSIAFLQYTSGTTTVPRGVVITHENIMNNQQVIAELMGHSPGVIALSWLPLYHDMGLSPILQMASIGIGVVLMPPAAFIQKPMRWLQAISKYRAHTSGGPNFAYELAANELRSNPAAEVDFSGWQVAFCGAEPIREKTVTEFTRLASAHGFKENVFFPCYGLAESTVAVTGIGKGGTVSHLNVGVDALSHGMLRLDNAKPDEVKKIINCGSTRAGNEVRIVDPNTLRPCADDEIGEIWVKGKSVGDGYWNNVDATRRTFAARTAGEQDGPYMRTGDLGALHGGDLYVTGRAKDLIIVRGRNLYPQDIEEIVQNSVEGLRKDCGAAFAVAADVEERLVIVQEVGRTLLRNVDSASVFKAVVAAVVEELAVMPYEIVLVRPASMPKTSSGKVQRSLCRDYYLQHRLDEVARWSAQPSDPRRSPVPAPRSASTVPGEAGANVIARTITETLARHLKIAPERISPTTPWAELGVDSLQAVRLSELIGRQVGLQARIDRVVGLLEHRRAGGLHCPQSECSRQRKRQTCDVQRQRPTRGMWKRSCNCPKSEATALLVAQLER